MALWRRRNVKDVRNGRLEHLFKIRKTFRNSKAFPQLFGHEQFLIADGYNPATGDTLDGMHMLVGNLATTNDGNAKHRFRWLRADDFPFRHSLPFYNFYPA